MQAETIKLPFGTLMPAVPRISAACFLLLGVLVAIREQSILDGAVAGAFLLAVLVPLELVLLVVCARTYDVEISEAGVSSYYPYGSWQKDFLTWADMREIQANRVLGVRYLTISADGCRPLWIPARAVEQGAFVDAVSRFGPDSRLDTWLSHAA